MNNKWWTTGSLWKRVCNRSRLEGRDDIGPGKRLKAPL